MSLIMMEWDDDPDGFILLSRRNFLLGCIDTRLGVEMVVIEISVSLRELQIPRLMMMIMLGVKSQHNKIKDDD